MVEEDGMNREQAETSGPKCRKIMRKTAALNPSEIPTGYVHSIVHTALPIHRFSSQIYERKSENKVPYFIATK
jgi:hypothetical protein